MICLILSFLIIVFAVSLVGGVNRAEGLANQPSVSDPNLKVVLIYQGELEFNQDNVSPVSSMTFLDHDLLLLGKNNGIVYRIAEWSKLEPLVDVNVSNKRERGLLGIAVSKERNSTRYIFLYYTESRNFDGPDKCSEAACEQGTEPAGNKIYKYELRNGKLINPKLLLNLPATPGPTHNGGILKISPDNNLYVTIGDVHGGNENSSTKSQNFRNGTDADGRSGILRITQDGKPVGNGILGNYFPLNLYYAYGIRNSFGIDVDPVTGILWDTENGPEYGDEINLVKPGFNSGWMVVQGIWKPIDNPLTDFTAGEELLNPDNSLVHFNGKGKYSSPEFIWKFIVGPTALKFFNSDAFGEEYKNDLFVASVHLGTIFHFDLTKDRLALKLDGPLKDKIADNTEELHDIVFAQGLGEITDIEVGPDGYLYVLSYHLNKLSIFKILPYK